MKMMNKKIIKTAYSIILILTFIGCKFTDETSDTINLDENDSEVTILNYDNSTDIKDGYVETDSDNSENILNNTIDFQNDSKEKVICCLFNQKYNTNYYEDDFSIVSVSRADNDTIFEAFCKDIDSDIEFRVNYSLNKQKIADDYAKVIYHEGLQQIIDDCPSSDKIEITDKYYKYDITYNNYQTSSLDEYISESDTILIVSADYDYDDTNSEVTDLYERFKKYSESKFLRISLRFNNTTLNI